ncbi:MAG: gliding motility-associated C-terminal domain-containing protein, partial [Bacteroidota bacterium]|nr:gliding motility-associated C-terminal domain-containing protein [Bacteroidota bacterium]
TAGVSYLWSSGETTQSVTVNNSANRTVTMTDINGCSATSTPVVITVNPLPTLLINTPDPVCAPGTIDLTAAAITTGSTTGLTYSQFTDIGLTQPVSNPGTVALSNTYYIKGTSSAGCSVAKPVSVVINSLPILNITQPAAVCAPASIDLTASAIVAGSTSGVNFSRWSDAANTLPLANANAITQSGIYYIRATLPSTGCAVSKPVSVSINPGPILRIQNPASVCYPSTVDLTSSGITAGSSAGINFSVFTDSNAGQPLANPASVAASGTYYIKGTDPATGCFAVQPVTVSVQSLPDLTIVNPSPVCAPGFVNITSPTVVSSNTAGISFTHWRDAGTTIPLTNANAVNSSGTYYVKGTTQAGCSVVRVVNVTIYPQPGLNITSPEPVCSPATINLLDPNIVAGSATGVSYSYWTDAAALTSLPNPAAVSVAGTYYIKSVFPATGCSVSKPVIVSINNPPALQVNTPAPVCEPALIDLTAAAITAGSTTGTQLSYWKDAANTIPLTNPNAVANSGTYFIRSALASGCTASLPVNVTINPLPNGILSNPANNFICAGSAVLLTATGADNYQWLLNQLPINGANTATFSATQAGSYAVRFISKEGCEKTSENQIQLIQITAPDVQFTTQGLCVDSPIQFVNKSVYANSGGISWVWDFGDGASSNQLSPLHSYQQPGIYQVGLTAVNASCPDLTKKLLQPISVNSPPTGIRYDTVQAVAGLAIGLTARPIGIFYEWQPASGLNSNLIRTPLATLDTDASYVIKITTAAGCTTYDSVYIKVTSTGEIFVPQGFSPNGDGQNDRAFPLLRGIRKMQYFKIYNRWGNLVFQTNDASAQNGWDGNYIGKPQPVGTYTWIAEAIDGRGLVIKRSGSILLIR